MKPDSRPAEPGLDAGSLEAPIAGSDLRSRPARVAWIHAEQDPVQSGELRRLGVPALLSECDGRTCVFGAPESLAAQGPYDLAVVPVAALDRLPLVAPQCSSILVEVDAISVLEGVAALNDLLALGNRVAGIVARAPCVVAWVRRNFTTKMPVWLVPDAAVRTPELEAAALAFGLPCFQDADISLAARSDVWFAEPGDRVGEDEVRAVVLHAQKHKNLFVIAPPTIRRWIGQAGARVQGADWTPSRVGLALALSSRCIILGPDSYSLRRRRALAFRSGAACPAEWSRAAIAHAPAEVCRQWRDLIDTILQAGPAERDFQTIMIVLDLVQDLDIALPLIEQLKDRPLVKLRVVVSTWLLRRSPRVENELAAINVAFTVSARDDIMKGAAPDLEGVDAIVSPAESSLSAHARIHALFIRAKKLGIPTFSVQHGVENVGLRQADFSDDSIETVLSDHLLTWSHQAALARCRTQDLGPRRVVVGRLNRVRQPHADLSSALIGYDTVVAVFENLHWNRYSGDWRRLFLEDLAAFARSHADAAVLLKPHHGGLWSIRNTHRLVDWPANLIIADPTDPYWEPYTANALIGLADLVITTPSTVALDAVEQHKPVAVAAYGLDLPAYSPLPLLEGLEDWQTFFETARTGDHARRRALFADRTVEDTDAPKRAGDYIVSVARERGAFRRLVGAAGTLDDEHNRHLRRG
jgi:hypothetical protein